MSYRQSHFCTYVAELEKNLKNAEAKNKVLQEKLEKYEIREKQKSNILNELIAEGNRFLYQFPLLNDTSFFCESGRRSRTFVYYLLRLALKKFVCPRIFC